VRTIRGTAGWERLALTIFSAGIAAVTFGSGYYDYNPNDATLFWDRLPMTIAFMSLLAITMGERIDSRYPRLLLAPLLLIGAASVVYWRLAGDLRWYALVQFYPAIAIPQCCSSFRRSTNVPASRWRA
jgi:hypothetical protein